MASLARITFRASSLVLLGLSIASCGMIKKKILGEDLDASADASVVAVDAGAVAAEPAPTMGPTGASNEDDVARFPDEVRLANVSATLQKSTQVRELPSLGHVVATLAKGTAVTQISQRDGKYFLVTFPNTKAPGTTLMGWVYVDAFSAPGAVVDAGAPKPLTCTAPAITVYTDAPVCGRLCAKDAECAAGEKCNVSAQRLKDGKPGDAVTICSVAVVHHDAGAPAAPVDAGAKPATVDAGTAPAATADAGAKPATTTVDAGAKPAATASTEADVVDPTAGRCAVGFMLVKKDNKCHRLCPTFGECKQKVTQACVACGEGNKVCTANRDICK